MITFSQRLQIEKNKKQIQQLLVAMETHGLNPHSFVDWFVVDGLNEFQNGRFDEAAQEFLENEIILAEAWSDYAKAALKGAGTGAAVGWLGGGAGALGGAAIGAGVGALGQLAKDAWKSDTVSGIRRGLARWISPDSSSTSTSSSVPSSSSTPSSRSSSIPSPTPTPSPKSTPTPTPTTHRDLQDHAKEAVVAMSNLSKRIQQSQQLQNMLGGKLNADAFTGTLTSLINTIQTKLTECLYVASSSNIFEQIEEFRQELAVRNALYDLEDLNINPETFVDCFIEGECFFQENYNENIGDWWSQFKANVEDAYKNWGKAGQAKQAEINKERDMRAINNAIQKLSNLESQIQSGGHKASTDFVKFVDEFKKMLYPLASLPIPTVDPAVAAENRKLGMATRWLKLGNAKVMNSMPARDVLLVLYDKSLDFAARRKPDVAEKLAWWTYIANAILNKEDPVKAADNFDVLNPKDDQTKIQLTKTYLTTQGLDSKLLPTDAVALKLYAKSEQYRTDKRKTLHGMTDWWREIVEKIKNGIDPLEEEKASKSDTEPEKKTEAEPEKKTDIESELERPAIVPLPDERTSFINELFDKGEIPPKIKDLLFGQRLSEIESLENSYIAVLGAIDSLDKNQPVQIWGHNISSVKELDAMPYIDETNLKWLQDYLVKNNNDVNQAQSNFKNVIQQIYTKFQYTPGRVPTNDSYNPLADQAFLDSITGKKQNKAAGWFNY